MDSYKPTIKTRVHEWLAERVSWIQYPERQEYQRDDDAPRAPLPRAAWLLVIVPVPILMAAPYVLLAYLALMYYLYIQHYR